MNTIALRDALTQLLKSPATPLVDLAGDTAQLPARTVGQSLQARVAAQLPNGRSLIDIGHVRFDVKLPVQARVGDTLQLQVIALQPRLTLSLAASPGSGVHEHVVMSESARSLGAVVERISQQTPAQALSSSQPVIASAPTDTAALAAGLKTALTRSGLFYESHQAQWVAGDRRLEDLLQEPQARLPRVASSLQPSHQARSEPQSPSAVPGAMVPDSLDGARDSVKPAAEAVHPRAIALVQQQLDILDTRQIAWQGQVWLNQSLDWRIEDQRSRDGAAADSPPVWKTSLHLHLPRLGEVTANLVIRGDQVHLAFADLTVETRSAVKAGQLALREAFGNAGLQLQEMKVD